MEALLRFGAMDLWPAQRRLAVAGSATPLGSRAFDLLLALVERRDRVVSKDELIDLVWPGLVVEENNLQVQISALRKALGAQAIATVAGRGYRFTLAPAEASDGAAGDGAGLPSSAPPTHFAVGLAGAGSAAGRAAAPRAGGPARLLVADDNKVNRLLLCRALELQGHQVISADDGLRALALLRSERPDLLLLDLEMPLLDGFGLLERRAADPVLAAVPVIVTSSLEGVAAVARCIELGADDYLHKPVNPVLLKARVDSSLERKRLRDRQAALVARLAPALGDDPGGCGAGVQTGPATLLAARLHLPSGLPAGELLELLNAWSTLMLAAAEAHGGLVHRYDGDAFAALFGLPLALPPGRGAPQAALDAAREMQDMAAQFSAERQATGRAPLAMVIAVASGEVTVGAVGNAQQNVLACVGPVVQQAEALLGQALAQLTAAGSDGGVPLCACAATLAATS